MSYLIPFHDSLLTDPIERRDLIEEQRRVWQDEMLIQCEECGVEHPSDYDCERRETYMPEDEAAADFDGNDDGFGDY